jgi:hypothetical protein
MNFTLIAPIHNEEKYIYQWIKNVEKLQPTETLIGLDRCTDKTEKILNTYIKQNPSNGFKTIKYDDTPNGYRMRAAGIRRDLYSQSTNDVIVNTSADILLDIKIREHIKQIGEYGLISFGYFDYPWNIQSFERYLISRYTPKHGFAGLLALSKKAWIQTEDLDELKTLPRAEDTHLQFAIRRCYPVKHINTKSWHLRPNETRQDHFNRGMAQYSLNTSSMLGSLLHSVIMFRPATFTGYMHARRR